MSIVPQPAYPVHAFQPVDLSPIQPAQPFAPAQPEVPWWKDRPDNPQGSPQVYPAPSEPVPAPPPADPWAVLTEPVSDATGPGSRAAAIAALAGALAGEGVQPSGIAEVLRGVNSRSCSPPLDVAHIDSVIPVTVTDAGTARAVAAFLRCHLGEVEAFGSSPAIRGVWLPTGEVVDRLVWNTPAAIQEGLCRLVGDLGTFAQRAHPDGTATLVYRAVRDLVPQARTVADTEAERFVQTLLNLRIDTREYALQPDDDGQWVRVPISSNVRTTLDQRPGFYPGEGLALLFEDGAWKLYVNLDTLVTGTLQRHPDWWRRGVIRLARILGGYPGFESRRIRSGWFRGHGRWRRLTLPDDYTPAGAAIVSAEQAIARRPGAEE